MNFIVPNQNQAAEINLIIIPTYIVNLYLESNFDN